MTGKKSDPLEPVPRYEFDEAVRRMEGVKKEADDIHKELQDDYKEINKRLEDNYYTKDGVRDQFKIELSDYKMIKAILTTIGVLVLGLIFAVVQQYIINQGVR